MEAIIKLDWVVAHVEQYLLQVEIEKLGRDIDSYLSAPILTLSMKYWTLIPLFQFIAHIYCQVNKRIYRHCYVNTPNCLMAHWVATQGSQCILNLKKGLGQSIGAPILCQWYTWRHFAGN